MKGAHTGGKHCHSFDAWEFDDVQWRGMSGPAVCGQWKNADA